MRVLKQAIWFVIAGLVSTLQYAGFGVAEPVSVNGAQGQGLIVAHRGNCFLLLPKHVHGRSRRVTIATSAPVTFGDAELLSFRSLHDLSIGYVSPGLARRCTEPWDTLPRDVSEMLRNHGVATLSRVSSSGHEERVAMRITGYDLEMIEARVVGKAEIYQGTSGGILRIDGTVAGMAVNSPNTSSALFLRIDQIKTELSRLLDAQAVATRPAEKGRAAASGGMCGKSSAPIASVACDRAPLSANDACSNLAVGKPTAFAPASLPVTLEVELKGEEPVSLSTISLVTEAGRDDFASPKSVSVLVDASSDDRRRWRPFGAGDATPRGTLQLVNGAKPYARRIQIRITSTWSPQKPLRLDCLTLQ